MSLTSTLTNLLTGRSAIVLMREPSYHAALWNVPEMEVQFARKAIGNPRREDLKIERSFITRDNDGWPVSVYYAN